MTIEFECLGCQKRLRVQDSAAGKKAKCPQCGTILEVSAAAAVEADDPFDFSAEPHSATAPPSFSDNPFDAPQTVNTGGARYGSGQAPPSGMVTAVAVVNYIIGGLQLMCGLGIMAFGLLGAGMLRAAAAQDLNIR